MNASKILPGELRRHHLFGGLNDEQLALLLETANLIHLDDGQQLFHSQQQARQFFMVRSGTIRLYLSAPDGSEKVIHLVTAGETFAEAITFMEGQVYPINASALDACELLAFSNNTFRAILRDSTETCFRLMADMSTWLKRQLTDIDALTLQNATLRFTNYLLHQVPAGTKQEVTIKLGAPKHVIASRLSIQPESFSRILRNLQREGHIVADGNLIHIKDINTLG
jgi:CRP/FNR family transcriptional regulator, dissimilatory nitrate respiration regulator